MYLWLIDTTTLTPTVEICFHIDIKVFFVNSCQKTQITLTKIQFIKVIKEGDIFYRHYVYSNLQNERFCIFPCELGSKVATWKKGKK